MGKYSNKLRDTARRTSAVEILRLRFGSFFLGKYYPVWIILTVFVGHATGAEVWLAIADLLLLSLAMLLTDSILPVIPVLITFLYRIAPVHSPGVPHFSNYYLGISRSLPMAIAFFVFLASFAFTVFRRRDEGRGAPLTASSIGYSFIFAVSFLTSGAFSGQRDFRDTLFSLLEAFVFFALPYLLYIGLRREKVDTVCRYFAYISALAAWLLIAETAFMYLGGVVSGGALDKEAMFYGWGIANTAGSAMSVLIPLIFIGVFRSKYSLAYFFTASVLLGTTALTLSRNALLFGAVFYTVCLFLACICGEKRKIYRVISVLLIALSVTFTVIFKDSIVMLFESFLDRGFGDNGRFKLWRDAFNAFSKNRLFGIGFYAFSADTMTASYFTPKLAHNTVFQLLSSMGLFGLISYTVYRISTVRLFLNKPTLEKLLLLSSVAVLLFESLLDNFLFWFAPTFPYSISIVIAMLYEDTSARDAAFCKDTA